MKLPQISLVIAMISTAMTNFLYSENRDLSNLRILDDAYPRAFFFRKAENIPGENPDYEKWNDEMSRLMGIIGKSLDEEVLGRQKNNPAFFTRFKNEHPEQVVLLHLNGNARDPRFQGDDFFAGHWIYRQPAEILEDIPATAGEYMIKVSNARLFRVNMGRYANRNDDIALFELKSDGTYDWHKSEQVQLLSIDGEANTITVKRGQYGTVPRAFKAGKSRAAAHQVEGPWGINNNIMWYYNYSVHCPRDRDGKTAAQRYLEDLEEWFGPGGLLHAYDGLEFDVLFNETHGDSTGDGVEDDGVVDGINAYGLGVVQFLAELRKRMGDSFIIQADGALGEGGIRSQRGWAYINGIESEGWPDLRDHDIHDWSGGLNRQNFAQSVCREPVFNYINHKFNEPIPGGNPGDKRHPDIGFNIHRLVIAAACLTDSALCYSFAPPEDPDGRFGIWDELRCGVQNRTGWLGKPVGPAVHIAYQSPDLLPAVQLKDLISGEVAVSDSNGGITIAPRKAAGNGFSFSFQDVPLNGNNLTVRAVLRAGPLPPYPDSVARFATLEASTGINLISNGKLTTGMRHRGEEEKPIEGSTGAQCRLQKINIDGDVRTAIAVHPPYKIKPGYTYWTRDVFIPENSVLYYATGMGPKSPDRSDGVWFSVYGAQITDGRTGNFIKLNETTSNSHEWIQHKVDLDQYAGKKIRLKFVADCGPDDNTTTDQASWSNVIIVPEGMDTENLTSAQGFMTWVGKDPFESSFYWRDIQSNSVNLTFRIEGTNPVFIESISAHAHPDVMYRIFENGLVLANPGPGQYTFDLQAIAPGTRFRRFKGTANQDPVTNNGQPVGRHVTLQAKDALFLLIY